MTEDLRVKLQAWIQKSGHALEMRVAKEFRHAGLVAIQADYYEDPVTQQLREIDVLAYRTCHISESNFTVVVVVECKRSPDKPWILLSRDHGFSAETLTQQQFTSPRAATVLEELASKAVAEKLVFFRPEEPLGYSMLTGLTQMKKAVDPTYKALRSVCTACEALLQADLKGVPRAAILAWPLIVLEGPFYRAWLKESGEMALEESDEGLLAWRHSHQRGHSFVRVVTESGLVGLIPQLANDIATLEEEGNAVLARSSK